MFISSIFVFKSLLCSRVSNYVTNDLSAKEILNDRKTLGGTKGATLLRELSHIVSINIELRDSRPCYRKV